MKRIDSTKIRWRVQIRKSRAHKWVNKGLFEVRDEARTIAFMYRECVTWKDGAAVQPSGFGNTRVVRYQKGES